MLRQSFRRISTNFASGRKPILRSEIEESEMFGPNNETIKSEAIIPIVAQDAMVGAIAFGSPNPFHFHEGLGTEFLERMADKVDKLNNHLADETSNASHLVAKLADQTLRTDPGCGHCG